MEIKSPTRKQSKPSKKGNHGSQPSKKANAASDGSKKATPDKSPPSHDRFLITAIGASAGGIEAFGELVHNLPPDTGMAFILIQHLDPTHRSLLTELIARETAMHVAEVKDGLRVEPNHVYVIPPNTCMTIAGRTLHLTPRETRGMNMPIDLFMRSLAEAQGDRAVGVILSGSGTDGTLGMSEIQAQGGLTFAQSQDSAKYDVMPRSAIAAGCVDVVLPPREIARELGRVSRRLHTLRDLAGHEDGLFAAAAESASLDHIFHRLRRATGVDFTHYRKTTILRRIHRRMVVHKIDKLGDYVKFLHANTGEIAALYQDLLINVTSFFRNPALFDVLKDAVFAQIYKNRAPDTAIRIWVPACASGEEVYSIAMGLLEFLGDRASQVTIQMFGTDVSESSVAKARAGFYTQNIEGDVSPERLRRFFTKVEGGYRIAKSIRDMCIFAAHNVADDPPFSQMDLVCCRNLLIYLEPILQAKVISLFHYALRPGGYLVLGGSEGIGSATNLFSSEDRVHKIFAKRNTSARQIVTFSLSRQAEHGVVTPSRRAIPQDSSWNYMDAQKEFDRRLIAQYVPAAVFVNEDMEVVHTRGNVGRYLKLPAGRASLSLLKMAKEGLFLELRNAVARAKKDGNTVRRQNIRVKVDGNGDGKAASSLVNLEVTPLGVGKPPTGYFMVILQDVPSPPKLASTVRAGDEQEADEASHAAKLEQELIATKEYLQSVIETHEATNEELQSANEEILSSNEELQSTNEELETAKEELQSANEELSTVNDELRSRNLEVTQVNNDLTAVLTSIDMAVIIVGKDLAIRRFTTRAQQFLGLIPGDIGRPLVNISLSFSMPDFHALVLQVVGNAQPIEKRVTGPDKVPYMLRILPYRTAENTTEGAVITLSSQSL